MLSFLNFVETSSIVLFSVRCTIRRPSYAKRHSSLISQRSSSKHCFFAHVQNHSPSTNHKLNRTEIHLKRDTSPHFLGQRQKHSNQASKMSRLQLDSCPSNGLRKKSQHIRIPKVKKSFSRMMQTELRASTRVQKCLLLD